MRKNRKWNKVIFAFLIGIIIYLSIESEIQPWYFLNLFIFLPFFVQSIKRLDIFFFGLLVSYYPYIRLGGWDSLDEINLKHIIISIFFVINIAFFLLIKLKQFIKQKIKANELL